MIEYVKDGAYLIGIFTFIVIIGGPAYEFLGEFITAVRKLRRGIEDKSDRQKILNNAEFTGVCGLLLTIIVFFIFLFPLKLECDSCNTRQAWFASLNLYAEGDEEFGDFECIRCNSPNSISLRWDFKPFFKLRPSDPTYRI